MGTASECQVQQDESDEQERKRRCHGGMNLHGGNPHDECVERPADEEPPHVLRVGIINVEKVEDEDHA
jgi:hypothetical protein